MNEQLYQSVNEQCCCFNLRKITRAITQFYDRYLEGADIRATQFTLLVELSNSSGKTLTEMAEGLVMDRTTLTRNLKPLSKSGLIVTVPLSDKRSKGYTLTERGHEVLARGLPLWKNAQQHIVGQLGHDRYHRLLAELVAMRNLPTRRETIRTPNLVYRVCCPVFALPCRRFHLFPYPNYLLHAV